MYLLSTRVHGALDYLVGLLLIALPWLLGFAEGGAETWVPVALGVLAIVYSLFTDYELGLVRVLPMPLHLWLDGLSGVLLAASPWLFGFADEVWVPHIVLGLTEIVVAMITNPHAVPPPRYSHLPHRGRGTIPHPIPAGTPRNAPKGRAPL